MERPAQPAPRGETKCIRCLRPTVLDEYLNNDYLCNHCSLETSAQYWARITEEDRQSKMAILRENERPAKRAHNTKKNQAEFSHL